MTQNFLISYNLQLFEGNKLNSKCHREQNIKFRRRFCCYIFLVQLIFNPMSNSWFLPLYRPLTQNIKTFYNNSENMNPGSQWPGDSEHSGVIVTTICLGMTSVWSHVQIFPCLMHLRGDLQTAFLQTQASKQGLCSLFSTFKLALKH